MVIVIPEGLYHMEQKYAIIKVNAERYRKGTKKVKGQMLDELTKVLNMNRQYISYLLRNTGRKVVLRERGIVLIGQYSKRNLSRRGRKKLYTADIEKLLLKIWVMSGFISSKHLQAFIRLNWDIIYSHFKGEIDREKGERLRNISAATIDRLLRRSRPYKKNDAPYVESKNWSMVRQYTGWRRYDTEEEYQILKKLTKLISLRHNLFIPQMKIIEKQRINGQVKKKYQIDIPVNRVLRMNDVDQTMKENLINLKNRIDIVKLTKGIIYLREKLEKIYNVKRSKQKCLLELE